MQPHHWLFDGILTAILALFIPFFGFGMSTSPAPTVLAVVLYALANVAAIVGIALRRASPPIALIAVTVSAVLQMCAFEAPSFINVAQVMVVYACSAYGSKRLRVLTLVVAGIGAVTAAAYVTFLEAQMSTMPASPGATMTAFVITFVMTLLTLGCAWLLGLARYLVLRSSEARVAQRLAEVERMHLRERMTVEEERSRIAREMHDVLAHSLVVIATLADGARYAIRSDPDTADDAVRTIGGISRDALTDVRRLLSELRHEQRQGPAASFDEFPGLIEQFTGLGLNVDLTVVGAPRPLTPGASLAALRTIQESLTNALRHGDVRAPVIVLVTWTAHALFLRVSNHVATTGGERAGIGGGHGLIGLRERVLLEAGTFSALRAGDEFRVDAAIPVGQAQTLPDRRGIGTGDGQAPSLPRSIDLRKRT